MPRKTSRFGPVPLDERTMLRAFLGGAPFVITGSDYWNRLNLGTTAVLATTIVYNTKRSGSILLDGRPFLFRRARFPVQPTAEWYVVDLIEHADIAGVARSDIEYLLGIALAERRFVYSRLRMAAAEYGTRATQALIKRAKERSMGA